MTNHSLQITGSLMKSSLAFALAVSVLLLATYSHAQVSTATINGVVKDQQDAVVPGATIVVTQVNTNLKRQSVTGAGGEYSLPSLPVGPYVLTVSKPGFASFEQKGIVLTVGQVATIPIALKVGGQTENVEVTAQASSVETTEHALRAEVLEQTISNLPLNGRNPAALLNTVAGVTDSQLTKAPLVDSVNPYIASDSGLIGSIAVSTHGVRASGTYYALDGASNVDAFSVVGAPFPNPDATQEFSVLTASYGARYVSAPGGAVNIVTKSGTNQIHGSVFEYLRNGYFNAQNPILKEPDTLKRNQFGGAIGAPIIKDKLFVFGAYQRTITRRQQVTNSYSPSADERNGIFKNAVTGATVTIPSFLISPIAQTLLQDVPLPNRPNNQYVIGVPIPEDFNQFTVKVDFNWRSHRLFARYFGDHYFNKGTPFTNNVFYQTGASDRRWDNGAVGDTWASKDGKWISDFRATYFNAKAYSDAAPGSKVTDPAAVGMQGITTDPGLPGFANIAGFVTGNPNAIVSFPRKGFTFSEDVTHLFGKHQLSFGGNYLHSSVDEYNTAARNPFLFFVGINSQLLLGGGLPLVDGAAADFLLGMPFLYYQQDAFYQSPKQNLFGLYVDDKYRATEKLTLTGGVRWDPYFPYAQTGNRTSCFISGQQSKVFVNAPLGLNYPGDPGCEPGGTSNKYGIVQPRVGFAYQLDSKGTMALRGGWGMYALQLPMNDFLSLNGFPYTRVYQITGLFKSMADVWGSFGVANPFADGFHGPDYVPPSNVAFPSTPSTISTLDPDFRPAVIQQWTLSLQKALTSADTIQIAYVGTKGSHLSNIGDLNQPIDSPTANADNIQQRRPNQSFQQIRSVRSDSSSNYNGLDVTYSHKATHLYLVSSFNWSKCIDDIGYTPLNGAATERDLNPSLTRGRCDLDQNLTWRTTGVWTLPALNGANQALRTIFGGWSASGLFTLDGGQPFTVYSSSSNSYSGIGSDYADVVSGQAVWNGDVLNPTAFTQNAPHTYGNSGRNSYRAKKFTTLDIALMKQFNITERWNVVFRTEAFNALNHFNPYGIRNTINATGFGTYQYAKEPRVLQFSLRVGF